MASGLGILRSILLSYGDSPAAVIAASGAASNALRTVLKSGKSSPMRRLAAPLFFWLWAVAAAPALAGAPAALTPLGEARVSAVIDGDTVALEDGRQVRLVGIQAPKLPLGRPNFKPWPLAEEAKAALSRLVAGKPVRLLKGETVEDRHGRVLAHLERREDSLWVEGEMLRLGLARVYTFADNRRAAAEMLAIEAEARAARRGLWADPYYAIRDAATVARHVDGFEIVEARVRAMAKVKGRIYLNFGDDWRRDFTVKIERRSVKLFDRASLDPAQWAGKRIRVRGWVTWQNGPMIEATHPEQIQFLD